MRKSYNLLYYLLKIAEINGIQNRRFASKLHHTHQKTCTPQHTHKQTNIQKYMYNTEDSYRYNLIERLYRSLGESTMNVTVWSMIIKIWFGPMINTTYTKVKSLDYWLGQCVWLG